jgi:hypothetical protein
MESQQILTRNRQRCNDTTLTALTRATYLEIERAASCLTPPSDLPQSDKPHRSTSPGPGCSRLGAARTAFLPLWTRRTSMTERMPKKTGEPAATARWLAAGFLTVMLAVTMAACGHGHSPTAERVEAGQCHVTCTDFSPSSYVAIAVSPSSLVCGSAANLPSLADTEKQAVAACGRDDCVPVVWGRDGVAAVAVDQVAYGWGWAPAASSTAERKAIASCESRSR